MDYECRVLTCSGPTEILDGLCKFHMLEWLEAYHKLETIDDRFVNEHKFFLQALEAFERNMLTDLHIYPAMITAEEMYEILRDQC